MPFGRRRRAKRAVPRTFTEKIRFRMENDRRDILRMFADKFAVRDYVAERVGQGCLPDLHHVTTDPSTIDINDYPRQFVLKASHGCAGSIVVTEKIPDSACLPPDPETFGWASFTINPASLQDSDHIRRFADYWLNLRYRAEGDIIEWAYQGFTPRILIEEYLDSGDPGEVSPRDIKFHCFDGRVEFIKHVSGRYSDDIRGDLLSPEWEHLDVEMTQQRSAKAPPRPKHLSRMVEMAEALAEGMDFVRVDLYELGDRIIFGEMTNYPEAGRAIFRPHSYDEHLGDTWDYFQVPGRPFR